jgi:hypothetical protein
MEYLNKQKDKILKYLFNTEEIELFTSNKNIKLNIKWNTILNYPEELNSLKLSCTSRLNILSKSTEILLNNKCIHPILLLLFHYELRDYIKYNTSHNDNNDNEIHFQLTSKNKKKIKELRPQINTTFKLYWKLINDTKIQSLANHYFENNLIQEIINNLYYQISIEELINMNDTIIETKKIKFNDICLNIDIDKKILEKNMMKCNYNIYIENRDNLSKNHQYFQNKILISINESNYHSSIDFTRKTNIYETTGKLIIDYNLVDDDIEIVYNNILKEISKLIYKNYDKNLGIIFYLVNIENINISIASFFLEIYNNTTKTKKGISIKYILSIFNEWEYVDKKSFMKMIKLELDNNEYFIEESDDLKNALLSSLGVDKLIFLPRKTDFINCNEMIEFVKIYNKFREGFFNTIENLLMDREENNIIIYLLKKLIYREEYEKFKQPLIDAFLEKILNEEVKSIVEKKFKIELDTYLPILQKSKSKSDIIDKSIIKKTSGYKISEIIDENFDNKKSEIKKRVFIPNSIIEFIIKNY